MDKVNSVAELIERTKDMPLEKMRFFINEDRKEPRCFGIYQEADTGHWVVYKNKSDGSRAVRYSGPDEGYAAQELWAKINSEIELRRAKRPRRRTKAQKRREFIRGLVLGALVAVAVFLFARWMAHTPDRGYYGYHSRLYYYQNDDWYYYDDGSWLLFDDDLGYDEWSEAEYYGTSYDGFDDAQDAFEYSQYYQVSESSSDDDDRDIFDSWDAGDTDWDTDW